MQINPKKLVIFDDMFPSVFSAFRVAEFNSYLNIFPAAQVYSCDTNFEKNYIEYHNSYPEFSSRITYFSENIEFQNSFGYTVFLNNAYRFLPVFLKNNMPFSFTLYPGGGFFLDDDESDNKLRTIFNSELFRKVIVTQKITSDYLIKKGFCKKDQIEFIYGGAFPLNTAKVEKVKFREEKNTFDICFVANKYTEKGIDKGYDVFISCAKELHKKYEDIFFHVVGKFNEHDIDVSELGLNIKFYGNLKTADFACFYKDKDIILSPNRPFVLHPGAFDGFPTGGCDEAGSYEVALFVSDPLKLNLYFEDGEDIVIIPLDYPEIVKKIEEYYLNPKKLYVLSQNGRKKINSILSFKKQIDARVAIISSGLDEKEVRESELIKKINAIQKLNIELTKKIADTEKLFQNNLEMLERKDDELVRMNLELLNIKSSFRWRIVSMPFLVIKRIIRFIKCYILNYIIPSGSFRLEVAAKLYQIFFKKPIKWFKKEKENARIKKSLQKIGIENFKKLPLRSFLNLRDDGRKKVLIIPSAYPTKEAPLIGTFFQDQGNVMMPDFDVKILYGQPRELNGKSFIYSADNILLKPEGLSFYYDYNSQDTESNNFERMVRAFDAILGEMIREGWRPDILHAQSSVYGGIVANYLGKKFKIPTILCENMMFLLHNFSKFLQNKIFEAFNGATKVTPPSTDKMRTILMHGIKCDPVIIGNMVDDDLFHISDKKNNNDVFEILIVAGASYIKDLHTFFNSVKEIINRGHRDIHATIIGNGVWGGENYNSYVKEIGIDKYCTFVNMVARNDMPSYYDKCDVFVSSSIAEGFQVSILEAMASGKPVVTTSHGGAEDNLRPENGILVGIRDYNAIADAIIKIKNHEIKFDPMVIRQTVVEKYGKVAFKKKIADIYNDVIDGK